MLSCRRTVMNDLNNDQLVEDIESTARHLGQLLHQAAVRMGKTAGQDMLLQTAFAWIDGQPPHQKATSKATLVAFLNEKFPPGQNPS